MKIFEQGKVIRHKLTNDIACVLSQYENGVLVFDLTDKGNALAQVILPRDYSYWVQDLDIEVKKKGGVYDDDTEFGYRPMII